MIEREDRGEIALLRLARGRGNALNGEFSEAICQTLDEVESSSQRAVVLTAEGSIFSAGVDLEALMQGGATYLQKFLPTMLRMFLKLFDYPKPVVAAINGHAIAGGCILGLTCDYRLMACGPGKIGLTETPVGVPFPPAVLEIVRLSVPPEFHREVIYLGASYGVEEGVKRGMVDELVEPEQLLTRALEVAERFAAVPPESFRLTKKCYRQPALDRAASVGARFDDEIVKTWCLPETHVAIQAFVDKNIKKK